jgi:DNA-binding NarL/FixJ family response regulator
MGSIRVLLIEDHVLVRKGLGSLLDRESDLEVVAEAGDGREGIAAVGRWQPDVVLMDVSMAGMNGIEATRRIRRCWPKVKVLVLTMHATQEHVSQMLLAGASGYVLKKAAPTELVSAIRAVHRGDTFFSPSLPVRVVEGHMQAAEPAGILDRLQTLTAREREVLQLIAEGHATRAIARVLQISPKTVESHRSHLMAKLDIYTSAGLTRYALLRGIVTLED